MKKYPAGGTVIGVMQVVDACILYASHGVASNVTLVLSSVEFLWAIVSLVVAIRVTQRATRILASVFFTYNASGWLLAFFVTAPTSPITVVPIWYVLFGGLFGLSYAASSIYVAKQP